MYIVLKADTDHLHITSFVTANEGVGWGGGGGGGGGVGGEYSSLMLRSSLLLFKEIQKFWF